MTSLNREELTSMDKVITEYKISKAMHFEEYFE